MCDDDASFVQLHTGRPKQFEFSGVRVKDAHFGKKSVQWMKALSSLLNRYKHDTSRERAETELQIYISIV
jgi:hypothetical protein